MKPRDVAGLLVLSLVWGSAFLFTDVVVEEVPPSTIVAGRMLLASTFLLTVALAGRRGLPPRNTWALLLVLAAVNNVVPFSLITWAQQHITSSLAATLNATMPLFTVLIVVAATEERIDAERLVGVAVGFAGAVVVIGPDFGDITGSNMLGDLAVIGASACFAVGTVIARQRLRGDPIVMAGGQMVWGALLAVPIALAVNGTPDMAVPAKVALSWAFLGLVSSGVAYVVFFTLVQRMSATQVSVVSYLIPLTATVLGWAVLDEPLGLNLFAGMALILAGLAAVNGGWSSLFRRGSAEERAGAGAPGG